MPLTPIPFHHVKINSPFWSPRLNTASVTARVCLDQCEKTGRLSNFRRAAGREEGGFQGEYFNDSDVYKVLEGVAYLLANQPDPELEAQADKVIDDICAAQQPDGYLNTRFTLAEPDKRWTDMGLHEAYCIGHLVEGAVAYAQATGKEALLQCAERVIAHMMDIFGPGKRHWVTGHQELELALVKLYRHTSKRAYLDYANWLISERGHGHMDAWSLTRQNFLEPYAQDVVPAAEQRKVTGHAVRAMYYYTGMADTDAAAGRNEYRQALEALWQDTYPGNTYITGGIGQSYMHEGFTRAWHKPNLTAYCETCAAIGMAMWNHRMGLMDGEVKYADLVETELYNGALCGISLDGQRFFYDNPLASVGRHHRSEWFGCSCCPTNLCRFIPSIGGYAYARQDNALYVNQYIGGTLDTPGIRMHVETNYPWDGKITFTVEQLSGIDTLYFRVPGWCRDARLTTVTGEYHAAEGLLTTAVREGDVITLELAMPIDRIHEDERVAECRGRVCIRRGPVVYCAEETDNPGIPPEYFPADMALSSQLPLHLGAPMPELADALPIVGDGIFLIPYALWDNRDSGAMAVWLRET